MMMILIQTNILSKIRQTTRKQRRKFWNLLFQQTPTNKTLQNSLTKLLVETGSIPYTQLKPLIDYLSSPLASFNSQMLLVQRLNWLQLLIVLYLAQHNKQQVNTQTMDKFIVKLL